MARKRTFLASLGTNLGIGIALFVSTNPAQAQTPPTKNILVILLDDIGPEQIQCYDGLSPGPGLAPGSNLYTGAYPYAPTPNISRLAREGVRFTKAFSSPVCSPTRAQLMTGRYPFRNQIGNIIIAGGGAKEIAATPAPLPTPPGLTILPNTLDSRIPQLPDDEVILPQVLGALAPEYSLGMFGKWHLSASRCQVDVSIKNRALDGLAPHPYGILNVDGEDHPILDTTAGLVFDGGWPEFTGLRANFGSKPNSKSENCSPDGRISYFGWFRIRTHVGMELPGYVECPNLPTTVGGTPILPTNACFNPSNAGTAGALSAVREYEETFITTKLRQDVEQFVLQADANDKPWCAVWAPQACHGPFTWPPPKLHSYGQNPSNVDQGNWLSLRFRALLQAFDTELGYLRAALSLPQGPGGTDPTIWENTVVILLGDNGTSEGVAEAAEDLKKAGIPGIMSPYENLGTDGSQSPSQARGFKGSPHGTGTSMICIISGPDIDSPSRTSGELVDVVDIFSTVRELAGIPASWKTDLTNMAPNPPELKIDGISLVPLLSDANAVGARRESLAMLFSPNGPFEINYPGLGDPDQPLPNPPPIGTLGGGDTRVYKIGYALNIDNAVDPNMNGIYRVIVERWVRSNPGTFPPPRSCRR